MNQVATQAPANATELVLQQEQFFSGATTSQSIVWSKESQFAVQAMQKNDFLAKTAMQNPSSLQNAIINVAAIEISLNPALKHAYLVPRDRMICLDISYMGLLHLAMQSGAIEWGQSKLVYANDRYVNNGVDKAPTHEQNTFGDKGDIIGCYCTVKLNSGDFLTEEMDIAALNKVKATSKANNGPWANWFDEMCRKTVVKRASKYWPTCERLKTAVEVINQHEGSQEINEDGDPAMSHESRSEEIKAFHELLEGDSPFTFAAFMMTRTPESQGHMYNSFEKGFVSSGKEKARNMLSNGTQQWKDCVADIKSFIAEEDVYAINEYIGDFLGYEKQCLLNMLGKHADELTRLLTEEK
jgi:recombination protein RecT